MHEIKTCYIFYYGFVAKVLLISIKLNRFRLEMYKTDASEKKTGLNSPNENGVDPEDLFCGILERPRYISLR